tara:strand:+ start:85 stop:522 length:438 start_codon:yes stop_codon:yes gene_type:complete
MPPSSYSFELESNPRLRFEDNGEGWVTCYLDQGDSLKKLGAESVSYLVDNISSALNRPLRSIVIEGAKMYFPFDTPEDQKKMTGEIDGQPVYWVCSLAEDHHSFYIDIDSTILYVEDDEGRLAERLTLDDACIDAWNEQLRKLSQ